MDKQRINENVDYFKNTVVKPFIRAMHKNNAIAYDVATSAPKKIQALYLLTDGNVGVRYSGENDPLHFEWTDYNIVAARISGSKIVVDSSKVYAHFNSFFSEKPIVIFDNELDGVYVAFRADLRRGEMTKLSVSKWYKNEEKKNYKYFYQAINAWAEKETNSTRFYDPERTEPVKKSVLAAVKNLHKIIGGAA